VSVPIHVELVLLGRTLYLDEARKLFASKNDSQIIKIFLGVRYIN